MSLARQLLLLQLVVVVVAVVVAGALAVRAADDRATEQQRRARARRSRETLAASGEVRAALRGDDPSARAAAAGGARAARVGPRVRRVHEPGRHALLAPEPGAGSAGASSARSRPAQRGRAFTETTTGTLGPSVRAVVADPRRRRASPGSSRSASCRRRSPTRCAGSCRACSRRWRSRVLVGGAALAARRAARPAPDARPRPGGAGDALRPPRRGAARDPRGRRGRRATTTACCWPTPRRGGCSGSADDAVGRADRRASSRTPRCARRCAAARRPATGLHVVGDRVLVTGQRPAERDGRADRDGDDAARPDRARGARARARHRPRHGRRAARAGARVGQRAAHGRRARRARPLRRRDRLRDAAGSASRRTRSTSCRSASAIRRSPRCCSPRRRRAASAASSSRSTATATCPADAASVRGPRDDRRQPRRQRARRARRRRGGRIDVRAARREDERGRCSQVRDDGPGIPADALGARVRGRLVARSPAPRPAARGLGLALVSTDGGAPRRHASTRPTTAARCSPCDCPRGPATRWSAR